MTHSPNYIQEYVNYYTFSYKKYLTSLDPNLGKYFAELRLGSHLLPISNSRYDERRRISAISKCCEPAAVFQPMSKEISVLSPPSTHPPHPYSLLTK